MANNGDLMDVEYDSSQPLHDARPYNLRSSVIRFSVSTLINNLSSTPFRQQKVTRGSHFAFDKLTETGKKLRLKHLNNIVELWGNDWLSKFDSDILPTLDGRELSTTVLKGLAELASIPELSLDTASEALLRACEARSGNGPLEIMMAKDVTTAIRQFNRKANDEPAAPRAISYPELADDAMIPPPTGRRLRSTARGFTSRRSQNRVEKRTTSFAPRYKQMEAGHRLSTKQSEAVGRALKACMEALGEFVP